MESEEQLIQDALDDFENRVMAQGVSKEGIISGLELKLYALREQVEDDDD